MNRNIVKDDQKQTTFSVKSSLILWKGQVVKETELIRNLKL